MATFNYYQEQKIIIWERTSFTIEAESQEEADKLIESQSGNDIDHMINIEVVDSEMLFETSQNIAVEDNDGFPTLKIYSEEQGKIIISNAG